MELANKVFSELKYPVYYDVEGQKVLDQDGKMVVDIRGWGWIQKLDKSEKVCEDLQDAFGEEMAKLINKRNNSQYSRLAVIKLINDFHSYSYGGIEDSTKDKWIEENLPESIITLPPDSINKEELWDKYSELLGTDIDSLSFFAGKNIIERHNFIKAIHEFYLSCPPVPITHMTDEQIVEKAKSKYQDNHDRRLYSYGLQDYRIFVKDQEGDRDNSESIEFGEWLAKHYSVTFNKSGRYYKDGKYFTAKALFPVFQHDKQNKNK